MLQHRLDQRPRRSGKVGCRAAEADVAAEVKAASAGERRRPDGHHRRRRLTGATQDRQVIVGGERGRCHPQDQQQDRQNGTCPTHRPLFHPVQSVGAAARGRTRVSRGSSAAVACIAAPEPACIAGAAQAHIAGPEPAHIEPPERMPAARRILRSRSRCPPGTSSAGQRGNPARSCRAA